MTNYQTDLDHAKRLADAADAITMRYFRARDLVVTDKPDNTPVTQGDTETEQALNDIITNEFHEQCLGEEGARPGKGERVWIIDPIDGTKNFLRGLPIWGTLMALTENGETVAAMVSCPALRRRWWAAKGMGAWTQEADDSIRQIRVSKVSQLEDAFILRSTPLSAWDKVPGSSETKVNKLLASVWRDRAPGDFINYMWLAEGAADVSFEPYAKLWDIEAPKLIVTEAGGSFWTNAAADTPPEEERVVVATNGPLEATILKALGL
ncbi:MAG TPA: inositol monophosphatase family protein [Candidatus Pristimantibacillus sp.]|nr:inositol monophosphatase family protein [Candidatus Pristimantibacillus sp.]